MEPTPKSFYDKLIEEGMDKGIYLEKANTIRRMYAAGFRLEQIAVLVEWSLEQVQAVLAAEA